MAKKTTTSTYRFRVSDSLEVPLRGQLLRLRLIEGMPDMSELAPGKRIRLISPSGETREVTILDHSETGGRATQERLEKTRELDLVISIDAARDVDIGWFVTGAGGTN